MDLGRVPLHVDQLCEEHLYTPRMDLVPLRLISVMPSSEEVCYAVSLVCLHATLLTKRELLSPLVDWFGRSGRVPPTPLHFGRQYGETLRYCSAETGRKLSVRAGSLKRENILESSGARDAERTVLPKGGKDSTLQRTGTVEMDRAAGPHTTPKATTPTKPATLGGAVTGAPCSTVYCPCRFIGIPLVSQETSREHEGSAPVSAPIFRTYNGVPNRAWGDYLPS